jgi:hypothetical protein
VDWRGYFVYLKYGKSGVFMARLIKESSVKRTIAQKAKSKKLSKAVLWWQKHPNGLDVIIHDMRAVMR